MRKILHPGENLPPVELAPEDLPPPDYPDEPVDGEEQDSLNWRSIIVGARLSGLMKNLAAQAQVLELTEEGVSLRLNVAAFATEANRQLLAGQISTYFGRPFRVHFEVGELTSSTVSDEVARERAEKLRERVSRFRDKPLVKLFMNDLGALIEENTVKDLH